MTEPCIVALVVYLALGALALNNPYLVAVTHRQALREGWHLSPRGVDLFIFLTGAAGTRLPVAFAAGLAAWLPEVVQ